MSAALQPISSTGKVPAGAGPDDYQIALPGDQPVCGLAQRPPGKEKQGQSKWVGYVVTTPRPEPPVRPEQPVQLPPSTAPDTRAIHSSIADIAVDALKLRS